MQSIATVLMKAEDAIINCNQLGPCEYVNVDVRFDTINHYIEGANKQWHVTTVSNVKQSYSKVVHFNFMWRNKK